MEKDILVMDGDQKTGNELRSLLLDQPYNVSRVETLRECENHLYQHACNVLVVDLDTVPIDSRGIARLKKKFPGICIIAKSERKFHPELEEALRNFIFACLRKPLDQDELNYWLKSVPAQKWVP